MTVLKNGLRNNHALRYEKPSKIFRRFFLCIISKQRKAEKNAIDFSK